MSRNTPILKLVLDDLTERVEGRGSATYGRPMTTGDGRDALWDAYEEALDLCCYLRKEIQERAERTTVDVHGYFKTLKTAGWTEDQFMAEIANLQTQMRCPDCDKALCVC